MVIFIYHFTFIYLFNDQIAVYKQLTFKGYFMNDLDTDEKYDFDDDFDDDKDYYGSLQSSSQCLDHGNDNKIQDIDDHDFINLHSHYPGFINLDPVSLNQQQQASHNNNKPILTLEDIDKMIHQFNLKEQQDKQDKLKIRRQSQRKIVPFRSTVNLQKLQKMKKLFQEYQRKRIKMNFNQISKQLMLGERTIYRYWKQFKKDSTLKSKEKQIRNNRNTFRVWKGEEQTTILRTQAILQLMKIHRKWTIDELAKILNKNHNLIKQSKGKTFQVHNHNICNILKRQGFKRMRLKKQLKSTKHSLYFSERKRFCQSFMENHNKAIPAYYFYIKQITIHFKRAYGWYRKDQEPQDQAELKLDQHGLYLTAFGGFEYPILWKVELETITPESYILKLLNYLNTLDDRKVSTPKMLICQRNSPLFRQDILQILKKLSFKLLFLPQKDYNLNPLQLWFHNVKLGLLKSTFINLLQIKQQIQKLDTSYIDNISQYLQQCLKYIQKSTVNQISININ